MQLLHAGAVVEFDEIQFPFIALCNQPNVRFTDNAIGGCNLHLYRADCLDPAGDSDVLANVFCKKEYKRWFCVNCNGFLCDVVPYHDILCGLPNRSTMRTRLRFHRVLVRTTGPESSETPAPAAAAAAGASSSLLSGPEAAGFPPSAANKNARAEP